MKNKYIEKGNMVYIELRHKELGTLYTTIDKCSFDIANQYKTTWNINYKNNHIDGVRTKIQHNNKRQQIWLHRIITKCPPNMVIDHRNGDTLNNTLDNLRIVTALENATNIKSNSKNKSGHTNIYFENNKYRVRIKNKSYGSYNTIDEALKERNEQYKKIFPLRER